MTAIPLLDVRDLTVEFQTRRGIVKAVQHVDLTIAKGETCGIVGESGSGKSVTSYAVMRILDRAGRIAEGSVMFSNLDVRQASEGNVRRQECAGLNCAGDVHPAVPEFDGRDRLGSAAANQSGIG